MLNQQDQDHNNLPQKENLNSGNLNDYILQGKIGTGGFGKVYRVKYKGNGNIYAAKISINEINERAEELFRDISREVNIISKLNHPSILKFIFYSPINFKGKAKPVIIMEYASNGSLKHLINQFIANPHDRLLTDTQKLKIIYGIASAMSYLHAHGILHRDLKPDNVLLDDYLFPKVGDFGLSKSDTNDILTKTAAGTIKGTPAYIAPEIWNSSKYSKASDVYAFSIVVFELMTCTRAFADLNFYEILAAVQRRKRPTFDVPVPDAYKWLIIRCWMQDPSDRPTFDEIVAELRTDRDYITESVDEGEFADYIRYVDDYNASFDAEKVVIRARSARKYTAQCQAKWGVSPSGDRMMMVIEGGFSKCVRIPREQLKLLSDASLLAVEKAESGDADLQLEVGQSLIEGRRDFPFDVKTGLNFLKASQKGGNKEAAMYYIKMLIDGRVIPQDHVKARKLIDAHFSGDESVRLHLHGKVLKKEKRYAEAFEFFKNSSDLGNLDSMCEIANLVQKGRAEMDGEDAASLYKKAISLGHLGAMIKLGVHKYESSMNQEERDDGISLIKMSADAGNRKAMRVYATIVEKEDDDLESESMKYFKRAADEGDGNSMDKFGVKLLKYLRSLPKLEDKTEAAVYMKKASDQGFTESMLEYGMLLVDGDIGIPQYSKEGSKYVRSAAIAGNADAMGRYGCLLKDGKGVDIDTDEAIKYLKEGIEKGSSFAMSVYGLMLLQGQGVPVDFKEAIKYFKISIDKGNSSAMNNYATMLKKGEGVPVDFKEAIKYYKMSIDKGNSAAMNNYAILLKKGEGVPVDSKEAIKYFKMSIDKGNSNAMTSYAYMLHYGQGVPVDFKEAIKYYKMAIDKGNSDAMTSYAIMLYCGQGVPVDFKEAIKYYKMAIDKGNSYAMNNYANMLKKGEGVPVDSKEAIKYFKMAIDKGNSSAMNNYAYMLHYGEGVPVDFKEAIKYYKMAIDKGNSAAMDNYASMLKYGQGVPVDFNEAIKYYKMSIDKGHSYAMTNYADMLRRGEGTAVDLEGCVKYCRMGIDKGNPGAMLQYAAMLESGEGVEADVEEANRYYRMALDAYDKRSFKNQVELMAGHARMLFYGKGVDRNEEEAVSIYRRAISLNDAVSMLEYGMILVDRNETEESLSEGIELIRKSGELGYGEALYEYGRILEEGKFVERNIEESIKCYEKASERCNRKAKESLQHLINHDD